MYQLDEKIWFWTLGIIPIILLLFIIVQFWKQKKQRQFANQTLLQKLSPNTSIFKPVLKIVILCLAFGLLSMALVNPKIGTKTETVKREGVDIVFALDVSKSMLAEDIAPNRLEKAKQLVTQIINNLASDRIGIIAYAGKAFPQLPITTDYSAAKMFLQNMNTNMLSSQGTAINEAINLAKTYYDSDEKSSKLLIIVSDGEDHSTIALDVAEEASKEDIIIFTIGVGDLNGGPIPIKRNGSLVGYKKDQDGETVITKLNEETLINIAKKANGAYINGKSTKATVSQIKDFLSKMDKTEFESSQLSDFKSQFQWFLAIAIFLLILDVFLLERKTAWLKKLNLFNESSPD